MFVIFVITLQSDEPMKIWSTAIEAVDPVTKELTLWAGPYVPGQTRREAEDYCDRNGLGYCEVVGMFIEIEEEIEICLN